MRKIYVTGPVGSGKSTFARALSRQTGINCCPLDDVVYLRDPGAADNRKRPAQERAALFVEWLCREAWILEDAGRTCFERVLWEADRIVLLAPPPRVRRWRILRRWVRQRLGLEACGYHPSSKMLQCMYRWSREYELDTDGIRSRLLPHEGKTRTLRSRRECRAFLRDFPAGQD